MTAVLLSKIVPNPNRDLNNCPLDEAQIEKLVHSIDRHGFLSGVRARPSEDGKLFQIAFGHTRIEAARRANLVKVDIDVRPMSDDEMLRLMVSENAIQAGSRAPVVMNEASAVIRRLAKPILLGTDLSQIRERWPEIAQ